MKLLYSFSILLALTVILPECFGDCVWFDKCGDDPDYNDGAHELNCVYKGAASEYIRWPKSSHSKSGQIVITVSLLLNPCFTCCFISTPVQSNDLDYIGLIKESCPHLLLEHGNQGLESTSISLCCSKSQVETFIEQNELPSLILGKHTMKIQEIIWNNLSCTFFYREMSHLLVQFQKNLLWHDVSSWPITISQRFTNNHQSNYSERNGQSSRLSCFWKVCWRSLQKLCRCS